MACAESRNRELLPNGGLRGTPYTLPDTLPGLLFLIVILFASVLPGQGKAAEGHVIFQNKSSETLELRFKAGRWTDAPVDRLPADESARAVVHFADGGVVVQTLGYAFSDDARSYCQVRVATVPGPVGCRIELAPINRGQMDCFARSLKRDRETCAFEVQVDVAPKRP